MFKGLMFFTAQFIYFSFRLNLIILHNFLFYLFLFSILHLAPCLWPYLLLRFCFDHFII
jgi:hypothetical protein